MTLPSGVLIEVFRWRNYIDLRLTMSRQPQQDGACSNFDGSASDDTTEAVLSRTGFWVPDEDLMFDRRERVAWTETEAKLMESCPDSTKARARRECVGDLARFRGSTLTTEMQLCMLDICYGKEAHVLRTAEEKGYLSPHASE
mmetsp:Transcript_127190/g.368245  ORF Transcript_127190/g.368245 Transcript_127190/m.368245 type:complete len:143 (+) Transcript_127190:757-1185(+)